MTFANSAIEKPMPLRRIVAAYLAETKFECLRIARSPAFVIPILLLPVGFYLLLGIAMAEARMARQGPSDEFIFVSFLVYGMLAPGLLGVSSLLASDRAQRILEYRQQNGGFKKIEELMNVRGIGEASFLKLKTLITVTPARTERVAAQ